MAVAPDPATIVSLGGYNDGSAALTIETHGGKRFVFSLGRYQLRLLNVMSQCALLGEPTTPETEGQENSVG